MKFVHQADGSIVCEAMAGGADVRVADASVPVGSNARPLAGPLRELRNAAESTASVVMILGGSIGMVIAGNEVIDAFIEERPVEHQKIIRMVHEAVRSCVLGTLTGAVVAPASLLLGLVRVSLRPALLGLAVHGASRWVARHHIGAAAVLKKLQSGDIVRQLEALRQLIARLSTSGPFCAQFKKLAGVEVLLKMLEDILAGVERGSSLLGGPQAALTVRALAELAKQGDAVNTMVDLGGIPLLLRAASCGLGLSTGQVAVPPSSPPAGSSAGMAEDAAAPGTPALVLHATAALARIASNHAVAQQMLASERCAAQLVVSLLEQSTARRVRGATAEACDELRKYAVTLAQALALEPVGKSALGNAGGVEALSAALVLSSPWTLGQATAAAALHALVRGDVENQRRLAAAAPAGLSAAINRALAAGGTAATGTAAVPSTPPSGSPAARAGTTPFQAADQSVAGLMGPAGRALAAQDCHAHRADLLALSNVISRFTNSLTASPVIINARSGSGRSTPGMLTPPMSTSPSNEAVGVAAALPAPGKPMALLQRLRLRAPSAKPAVVDATADSAPVTNHAVEAGSLVRAATPAAPPTSRQSSEMIMAAEVTKGPSGELATASETAAAAAASGSNQGVVEEEVGSDDWDCTVESAMVGDVNQPAGAV